MQLAGDFDRVSRHVLAARLVRAACEPGSRVLDIGGSQGFTSDLLADYLVVPVDVAGKDVLVRASADQLPFDDRSFDAVVALDLLEHLPRSVRSEAILDFRRVARDLVIVGGPFDSPEVLVAECRLRDAYQRLTGEPHRWLTEHLEFGLPTLAGVEELLSGDGWSVGSMPSNPIGVWMRLQLCNFVGASTGDRQAADWVHRELNDRFLDNGDADEPAYRHLLVASRAFDAEVLMRLARTPAPGEARGWTSSDAIGALDETTVGMIERYAARWRGQNRELEHAFQLFEVLREQLHEGRSEREELRSELVSLESKLGTTHQELRRRSDELRRLREEGEGATAARDDRVRLIRKSTEEEQARAADLRAEISRLEGLLGRLDVELRKLLTSRRWLLGDAIGDLVLLLVAGGRKEKASDRIRETLGEVSAWQDAGATLMQVPPSSEGGDGVEEAVHKYATSIANRRLLEEQCRNLRMRLVGLELRYRQLLSSTRWRIGKLVGDLVSPFNLRRRRAGSTHRIDALFGMVRDEGCQTAVTGEREVGGGNEAKRPGVTFESDAAGIQAAYGTYIAAVEPGVLARLVSSETPSLRVVVNARGADVRSAQLKTLLAGWESTSLVAWAEEEGVIQGNDVGAVGHALNAALNEWSEEWVVLVKPGDRLAPELLSALHLYGDGVAAVVFDDDVLGRTGRERPRFKPGFSPEWLLEYDYVGRGVAFRVDAVRRVGGFGLMAQDLHRDMLTRMGEAGEPIGKVDAVLLHAASETIDSTAAAKKDVDYARYELNRRGVSGAYIFEAAYGPHVLYRLPPDALVSIIIPFRDKAELLQSATDSIFRLTIHPNYEVILVNNRSQDPETLALLTELRQNDRVRVVDFPEPFNFSRAVNLGATVASGEVLVLLNNDTKVLTPDWLEELCGYALRSGIGAVGALLRYPNGAIQHAGVVVGMLGFAGHLFAGEHPPFVPSEYLRYVRNCSAVTAACLAVARDRFMEVGGLDEAFTLTGNDVDLCLRLGRAGYRNLINPNAQLIHYEKQSRAGEKVPRSDQVLSLDRYQPFLAEGDPYFNKSLSLRTTRIQPRVGDEPGFTELRESVVGRRNAEAGRASVVGFLKEYDATGLQLEENARIMQRFAENRQLRPEVINWFIPPFDHVYRGGIYTIMRFAEFFSMHGGVHNRFVLCGSNAEGSVARITGELTEEFPGLHFELCDLRSGGRKEDLASADIGICTLWTTAYPLLRFNRCRGKFYFVQDYEPGFEAAGATYGLIEETYRFGFIGLANTPGVGDMYRAYGNDAHYFLPGVDHELFYPSGKRDARPLRIVFYGRPRNARNGFALGVEALIRIKELYGEGVEILSVGADFREAEFGLDGVLKNLGVLSSIREVAALYRSCDIGVVFMFTKHPSYQPLEFMASGCATVSNVNEANGWLLRTGENSVLAPPTVSGVVEAISKVIDDEDLRRLIVAGGLATTAERTWDLELELAYRFVTTGESRDD